jgi:hypothetical integral membrane protein (TIGR02206 family)
MFFSFTDFGHKLELFTPQYYLAFLIFAVIPCFLVYLLRNWLRKSKLEPFIRISIGVFGLLLEFSLYAWYIFAGKKTDWREIIPTTLCGLTILLSSYAMITLSKRISPIIYFYSFGAFFSFVFADISYGYDRYRFYSYFVIHGLILVNTVYLRAVNNFKADGNAFARAALVLFPFLVLSVVLNKIFDMNFFYMEFPIIENIPVYTKIYEINVYLYSLAVFASHYILMLAMYGIAKLTRMNRSKLDFL